MVQFTTRSSRWFAELGPIPHWLYYTPLRKNGPLWSKVVIWSSGIATVVALMGLIAGLMMYSPSRKNQHSLYGAEAAASYSGLVFRSGGLHLGVQRDAVDGSVPGEVGRPPGVRIGGALRGKRPPLSQYAAKSPREALAQVGPAFGAKELELTSFAGDPVYLARTAGGETRIVPMRGDPLESFDRGRI